MDKRRALFWAAFLGGAGVLALLPEYFERPADEIVQPVARGNRDEAIRPVAISPDAGRMEPGRMDANRMETPAMRRPLEELAATRQANPSADLFAAHSWYVPPPPPPPQPAVVVAPPPPSAPPLPFQFLGKMDDSERLRVFLSRGDRIHNVTEGDVIDNTYRVERISDTQMTLTYLPLNIAQTLSVGSKL